MDQQIENYFDQYVTVCLEAPLFAHLPHEEKEQKKKEIQDYFHHVIINLMIDLMSEEQVERLQNMDLTTPEGLAKVEEIASEIPNFSDHIDDVLQEEVMRIQETGVIRPPETQTA